MAASGVFDVCFLCQHNPVLCEKLLQCMCTLCGAAGSKHQPVEDRVIVLLLTVCRRVISLVCMARLLRGRSTGAHLVQPCHCGTAGQATTTVNRMCVFGILGRGPFPPPAPPARSWFCSSQVVPVKGVVHLAAVQHCVFCVWWCFVFSVSKELHTAAVRDCMVRDASSSITPWCTHTVMCLLCLAVEEHDFCSAHVALAVALWLMAFIVSLRMLYAWRVVSG